MSLRPSEAQQAERCAYAMAIRARSTPTTSPAASQGKMFAAIVARDADKVRDLLVYISDADYAELTALAGIYNDLMPRPKGHMAEWSFALNRDGILVPYDDETRVTRGFVDAWWQEPGLYVVRDDKTGERPVEHPRDNLQLAPYLKAVSVVATFGSRPVGEIANPRLGTLVRYEYQPGEVDALWKRFLKAEAKTRVLPVLAEPGGHCSDCWERERCDVRLLPAMEAEGALMPFMAGQPPLTRETAAKGLLTLQAAEEVVERCKEHLKAWVLENGPITDGDKEWGPVPTSGRESADLKAIKADGLTQYVKQGKPFLTYRWTKRSPF